MNTLGNAVFVTSHIGGMQLSYTIRRGDKVVNIESFGGTPDESVRYFWDNVRKELGKYTRQGFSIIMDGMYNPDSYWTSRFRSKMGGGD